MGGGRLLYSKKISSKPGAGQAIVPGLSMERSRSIPKLNSFTLCCQLAGSLFDVNEK